MKMLKFFLLMLLASQGFFVHAQNYTQTVRGRILDGDSKIPVIGANIVIENSDPLQGGSTDPDGYFVINNVAIGKVNLIISAIAYETQYLSNIVVESGKESFVDVEMIESFETLEAVTVVAEQNEEEPLNNMALISSKTFTVEETSRYAGALNDPARMVSAFAGVNNDGAGDNDIIVRGNSPRGVLWRLEGIEIPNPNHFANEGSTGGPVNSLNGSMLANSDFFSGAFTPEYGNALSGVFDTRFRTGNKEKHENIFSFGVLGVDLTSEGPFKEGYNGSYLANYRYSSIAILDALGVLDFDGIPKYQDASFKLYLPTEKSGYFTLFGLYGDSGIDFVEEDEETGNEVSKGSAKAGLSATGLKHNYIFNDKTYLQSYVMLSSSRNEYEESIINDEKDAFFKAYDEKFTNRTLRVSTSINRKISQKNNIKTGIILSSIGYDILAKENPNGTGEQTMLNQNGNMGLAQVYTSWKYRILENLTMVSGLHYTHLFLDNQFSLDPRLGVKWQFTPEQNLTLGLGLHSKVENASIYLFSADESGISNEDLELSKAMHFVVGYGYRWNNVYFKSELYYQHLFDVPVEAATNSNFSLLNNSSGLVYKRLNNEGTGKNYGIELTVERYYKNNYYYMVTGSFYESRYTAADGIERGTRFNGNYSGNIVFGKEFQLKSAKNNKTLAVNMKTSLIGGNRYTAIDLEASNLKREAVYDENNPFGMKGDDIFFVNMGVSYRVNRKKTTHEFKIDIQNVTNQGAVINEYYNSATRGLETQTQLPFIPNIMYQVKF